MTGRWEATRVCAKFRHYQFCCELIHSRDGVQQFHSSFRFENLWLLRLTHLVDLVINLFAYGSYPLIQKINQIDYLDPVDEFRRESIDPRFPFPCQ